MDFNTGWVLTKPGRQPEPVTLPCTWNEKDRRTAATIITAAPACTPKHLQPLQWHRAKKHGWNLREPP